MTSKTVGVIGLGMIGGSVCLALREAGHSVHGFDSAQSSLAEALEMNIVDAELCDVDYDVIFVAAPIPEIGEIVADALLRYPGAVVSDVGSVKGSIVAACSNSRFVGGHPMAGSEIAGIKGADKDRFKGATWVLTPDEKTGDASYLLVKEMVEAMGAHVVTIDASTHDDIVAVVSHVPHLAAAALMLAASGADGEDARTLRLSATGFKDMTRIAAGDPGLWSGIALANEQSIARALDILIAHLQDVKSSIENGDRDALVKQLTEAAGARRDLPSRQGRPREVVEIAIDIADRPGTLREVFDRVGSSSVNVEDVRIDHAADGTHGTLFVTVAASDVEAAISALQGAGLPVWLVGESRGET